MAHGALLMFTLTVIVMITHGRRSRRHMLMFTSFTVDYIALYNNYVSLTFHCLKEM